MSTPQNSTLAELLGILAKRHLRSLPMVQLGDGQPCGECNACCTILSVMELKKPYCSTCEHILPSPENPQHTCGIYSSRPESCKSYSCLWRELPIIPNTKNRPTSMPETLRPDQCGFMLTLDGDNHGLWIEVHFTNTPQFPVTMKLLNFALLVAKQLFEIYQPAVNGIKFYHPEDNIGVAYPVDTQKYPNHRLADNSPRDYESADGVIYWHVTKQGNTRRNRFRELAIKEHEPCQNNSPNKNNPEVSK